VGITTIIKPIRCENPYVVMASKPVGITTVKPLRAENPYVHMEATATDSLRPTSSEGMAAKSAGPVSPLSSPPPAFGTFAIGHRACAMREAQAARPAVCSARPVEVPKFRSPAPYSDSEDDMP
jgi:hypothetical protein